MTTKTSKAKATPKGNAFPSTDDQRVRNTTAPNVMRHQYRPLTDAEKTLMVQIKDMGKDFYDLCDGIGTSRELSIAKTKIEEAVMWSVKHLTR